MRHFIIAFLVVLSLNVQGADAPRLVVVITIDGLPQEQIVKYQDQLGVGGFNRLLREGAWFANAHHGHATTYTAVGHAAILTGAYPYRHGVVGNDWWDRAAQKRMYCCADAASSILDEPTKENAGTSPRNLQVTTVGDELRLNTGLQSKVVSVSIKDRGAIFTGGKTGLAYWFSKETGRFITSNYYAKEYPAWWKEFHAAKPQDKWLNKVWEPVLPRADYWRALADGCASGREHKSHGLGLKFPHPLTPQKYYDQLRRTPFGDEYTLEFVLAALKGENLGKNPRGVPDLLAVSFSCHDELNHQFGAESVESQDNLLRLDQTLATFFAALDQWVGLDHVLVALTADHGFANSPEFCRDVLHLEAGRIDPTKLLADLNAALGGKFVVAWFNPTVNFDLAAITAAGRTREDVERVAADFLENYPGIHTVFSRTQLRNGQLPATRFGVLAGRSWHRQFSGDLLIIQQPGWYLYNDPDESCVTHGSPWTYDTHVPLLLMGKPWIKSGQRNENVEVVDLATTLATVLQIRPPSGTEGRVLHEILR